MRDFEAAADRASREGRREQRCPGCGREEAGGSYCTACYRPVHPEAWIGATRSPAQEAAWRRASEARHRPSAHQDARKPSGLTVGPPAPAEGGIAGPWPEDENEDTGAEA